MNELSEDNKQVLVYLFIKYPNGLPYSSHKIYTTTEVWNELCDVSEYASTILGSKGEHARPRSEWYSCETGITEEGLKVIKEMSDGSEAI